MPAPHVDPAVFGLRLLRLSDIPQLVEWEKRERPYPWTPEHFSETLGSDSGQTLILERENEIIGFAVAQVVEDEGYLQNILVSPAHRRKGEGGTILQKVMMWAKARGASSLTLDVEKQNEAAIRLYNKFGFQILERREKSYPHGEDSLLMSKILS